MVETKVLAIAAFVGVLAMSSLGCEPAYQTAEPAHPSNPPIPTNPNPREVRFDLRAGEKTTGHVLAKTSGAYLSEINGEQRTIVAVSIEVDNAAGARELVVDPTDLRLVAVDTAAGQLDEIASAGSSGRVAVAVKETATVRAHFALPSGVTPNDIRGYELQWALRDGDRLVQMKTPFVESGGGVGVVAYAAPLPRDDRSQPTYYAPYAPYAPYGYYYGGVFYDTHVYPYGVPHHNDITIVPIVPHLNWGHHFGTHDYGGGVYHGGSHGGGGSYHGGSHYGGGHHGGGHHKP